MAMTLMQMSAFREVMRLGSVSEAARALSRTQPAISAQIKSLEEELGCALFTRNGKRLVARPEAQYLLREAEQILGDVAQVERNMRNLHQQVEGDLTLLATEGACATLLSDVVAAFVAKRPKVRINLETRSESALLATMATQGFDIALMQSFGSAPQNSPEVETKSFSMESYCAIPSGDPLAKQSVVTPSCLSGRALGCRTARHPVTQRLNSVFATAKSDLNLRVQMDDPLSLLRFTFRGQCCAIVDSLARRSFDALEAGSDGVTFVPFALQYEQYASLLRPKNRPLSKLAELFQETLTGQLVNLDVPFKQS